MNTSQSHTAWKDSLAPGDVVSFCFPHEREGSNAPKVRPSLVLDVEVRDGQRYAHLAYGTTSPTTRRAGYAIDVTDADEIAFASLHKPTRFDAARRVIVSLANHNFDVSPTRGTPVLGRLTGRATERMHRIRARIHAEHHMRRAGLFRTRRGYNPPREITVERRKDGRITARQTRNV
ncbi:hypothetical protein SAMN05421853_1064 [Roseivivax halotolerans]|uniref:Type II toxin-antitoxin system PemK/MazF family toxin n=1 Tax=Roseivivax halotolerans TaxID=93684 RepID=A0A1I5YJW2_9RHOB|nr:hypothetical protein [Roseivivax halotolerans]SFQ44405.1 hypothetical protein SAMN05421853_1064 [Roseivivax halotolerans]